MPIQLGDLAPDFDADSTEGRIRFHEWLGNAWEVIGLSVDRVTDHERWAADIKETQGVPLNYPLIGDPDRSQGPSSSAVARRPFVR